LSPFSLPLQQGACRGTPPVPFDAPQPADLVAKPDPKKTSRKRIWEKQLSKVKILNPSGTTIPKYMAALVRGCGWSVGWLVNWLGGVIDRVVGWSGGRLFCRLVNWLVGWLDDWLAQNLNPKPSAAQGAPFVLYVGGEAAAAQGPAHRRRWIAGTALGLACVAVLALSASSSAESPSGLAVASQGAIQQLFSLTNRADDGKGVDGGQQVRFYPDACTAKFLLRCVHSQVFTPMRAQSTCHGLTSIPSQPPNRAPF